MIFQPLPVYDNQIFTTPLQYHHKKEDSVFPIEITG